MRVGLDCSSACAPEGSGVSQYIVRLLGELAAAAPTDQYVACWRYSRWKHRHELINELPELISLQGWQGPIAPARAAKLNLFHGLDARLPRWSRVPTVVTIHDLFPAVCGEFASEKFNRKKLKQTKHAVESASAVICVSQSTADDVREHLDVEAERIVVVPEGASERFHPSAATSVEGLMEAYPIPEHYILFVGQLNRRKNAARMVRAFTQASPSLPEELHFVLAGAAGDENAEVTAAIEESAVSARIHRLGHVKEAWKPALYASASGLAYVTQYEGFGLPIVEAMASGCPVLTSSGGASPEVGGDVVLTADPNDEDAIAEGMVKLMGDNDWRRRVVAAGVERAKQYTWARTALATRLVYHRVLSGEPLQS